ncbi:hypothetical protein ACYRFT_01395 [Listeria kieliensis]
MFDLPNWILWGLPLSAILAMIFNLTLGKIADEEAEQENGDS